MKPSKTSNLQDDLFKSRLSETLNPREPLFVLSHQLPWEYFGAEFSPLFTGYKVHPPKPVRLMIGLFMLQHMESLSDGAVVERWVQNPDQEERFKELLEMSRRLLDQTQKSKNKLYSLHAPHTYCIVK